MRKLFLAAWAAAALVAGPALAADPVEGDWLIGDDTRVHIAPCPEQADRLCGAFAWMKDPTDSTGRLTQDEHNPDPRKRNHTLLGLTFMHDFKRLGPGRWSGGKIYNPDNGKSYDSKMHLKPEGTLRVEGCVLMFCGGQTWRRANEAQARAAITLTR